MYEITQSHKNSNQIEPIGKKLRQFITFEIGSNFFGADIRDIKEINEDFFITPVFHAPEGVEGYVNLRGEIYLIINLRVSLGLEIPGGTAKHPYILIFKERAGELFGIIVDSIGDVIDVDENQIELYSNASDDVNDNFQKLNKYNLVEGICKLPDRLMIALRATNLLSVLKRG